MKNTCKNRALNFIRFKNHINSLAIHTAYIKVSAEIMQDKAYLNFEIERHLKEHSKNINKLIGCDFSYEVVNGSSGLDGDDFILNLNTIKLGFVKKV